MNSNVPVTIAPQNIQAIMVGAGDGFGQIKYVKDGISDAIDEDSIVYTSGTGAIFKSGVPIGKLKTLENGSNSDFNVEFYSDFSQLKYVFAEIVSKNQINKSDNLDIKKINPIEDKIKILEEEVEIIEDSNTKFKEENDYLKTKIMKRFFLNAALALALVGTTVACKGDKKNETEAGEAQTEVAASEAAAKYKVDTAASSLMWMGSKPTGKHNGTVAIESGVLNVENGTIQSGTFIIDMTTIESTDLEGDMKNNLDAHLRGTVEGKEGDFFNVQKYPNAAFSVTGVTEKDGKTYVQGNLQIKEKKNNIEFPVTTTMNGDTMTLESEPFTIDRTKWDVNYGSKSVFDNLGDKWVSDDMEITVKLVANKA